MKKILLLCIVMASANVFSQSLPCASNTTFPTNIQIHPTGAITDWQSRIDIYRNQKNPVDPSTGRKDNIDSIIYTPCGFLSLLKALADPAKGYTGLRIYLGSDTDDASKRLKLIFVPTKGSGNAGSDTDPNADTIYWTIDGDHLKPVDKIGAQNYTNAYHANQMQKFTANGQKHFGTSRQYEETRELWYNISIINAPLNTADSTAGMLTYLQCLINTNNIDNVVVYFAGFTSTSKYDYQIDLLFNFYKKAQTGTVGPAMVTSSTTGSGGVVDTGVPCPPPPVQGGSCPGA
jgi:hypothetical protein